MYRIHRFSITVLALGVLALGVLACGGDKEKSGNQAAKSSNEPGAAATKGQPADLAAKKAAADKARREFAAKQAEAQKQLGVQTESGPADWSSREALCAAVFSKEDIGRLVGREDLQGGHNRKGIRKPVAGVTKCQWTTGKPKQGIYPELTLGTMIDCRRGSLNVDRYKSTMKAVVSKNPDDYKDISLGKGGGHIKMALMGKPSYQVNFVHETAPCAVNVNQSFQMEDVTEKVAEHMNAKLTADTAVLP